jgi:hypothetical protein
MNWLGIISVGFDVTDLQSSIMRSSWAGHVARMGQKRNAYRLLEGKARGKVSTRITKTKVGG